MRILLHVATTWTGGSHSAHDCHAFNYCMCSALLVHIQKTLLVAATLLLDLTTRFCTWHRITWADKARTGMFIQCTLYTDVAATRAVGPHTCTVKYSRLEWFCTFLRFSKSDTFLSIRYIFISLIPKKSATSAARAAKFTFSKILGTLKMYFFSYKFAETFLLHQRTIAKNKIRSLKK